MYYILCCCTLYWLHVLVLSRQICSLDCQCYFYLARLIILVLTLSQLKRENWLHNLCTLIPFDNLLQLRLL